MRYTAQKNNLDASSLVTDANRDAIFSRVALTAQAQFFFVFSVFDNHAVLCAVKSDNQKFNDKAFINRPSGSQIKHITEKSNSRLRQKVLCEIDHQSFAVDESLFVSRRRQSRWRLVCNEYLASTLSIHFCAVQGSASDRS